MCVYNRSVSCTALRKGSYTYVYIDVYMYIYMLKSFPIIFVFLGRLRVTCLAVG